MSGDRKLGRYDPVTELYREFDDDGKTLGRAKTFPWKRAEPKEEPAPRKAMAPPEPIEPPKPWMPYAVGGGVAALLFVLALAVQFRG